VGNGARAAEVVTQTQRVAYFVVDQVAQGGSVEFLWNVCGWIDNAVSQQCGLEHAHLESLAVSSHTKTIQLMCAHQIDLGVESLHAIQHAIRSDEVGPLIAPALHEDSREQDVGVQDLSCARIRLRGTNGVAHLVGCAPADG